eukprot:GHUV01048021.1.p1 GENE.GHUV01048021.1~~GHUV01048021.1.p1  ORF type:complete len:135 (+),score=21.84 GHUV01048021.1:202-606(+)
MTDATLVADASDLEPSAKRLKTAPAGTAATGTAGVIRPGLLSADNRTQLRRDHDTSGPYTHLVLKNLCDEQLLRAVRDEVIHNISATYKETDLFKVFQTGMFAVARSATHIAQHLSAANVETYRSFPWAAEMLC